MKGTDYAMITSLLVSKFRIVFTDKVSGEMIAEGSVWYESARQMVRMLAMLYGTTTVRVAEVIAGLSPLNKWTSNVRAAQYFLNGDTVNTHRYGWASAWLKSGVLSGPKVVAFFGNLAGNELAVTVDSWMFLLGRDEIGSDLVLPKTNTPGFHNAIADAIKVVAFEHGYTPAQMQAILWLYVRSQYGYRIVKGNPLKG